MRPAVFSLLLLCSVAASAQITISDEVVSDPLERRLAPIFLGAPALTLAQDRTGVAVAWTMSNASGADRIYVTRLDAAGHATGEVRTMPITLNGVLVHAIYPSLAAAPGGDGFLLGWQEMDATNTTKALPLYTKLDASLAPAKPTVLFQFPTSDAAPVLVRSNGDAAWITVNNWVWPIQRDGSLGPGPLTATFASDMVVGNGFPDMVGNRSQLGAAGCLPGCLSCFTSCRVQNITTVLNFTGLYSTSQVKPFTNGNDSQVGIASNGSELLIVWMLGPVWDGGDVVATRVPLNGLASFGTSADKARTIGSFPRGLFPTRPSVASDGQHFVAVWNVQAASRGHDVVGAVLDPDGKITPLSIAASTADESDPDIVYLGGGEFLVGYEKTDGGGRHIGGRFVRIGRPHAIH